MKLLLFGPSMALVLLFSGIGVAAADDGKYAELVAGTHRGSLAAREQVLRRTIAKDSCWPPGAWGETMWALAALHLNEKVDLANERLLKRARDYNALHQAKTPTAKFAPEAANDTPWSYFALTDYLRILYLFRADRLQAETEAAMKESLWFWVKTESKLEDASLDNLLLLLGTENHDLTRRPNHYLISALLKDDPVYRDRAYNDGHTAAEHAAAYAAYFREWPRLRATSGLWFEIGSDTYQKYSWPALFNLHELSPDPVIRKRFGLLLDLAFIEEAQISVRGRRGGGRSRAGYGKNAFEAYKDLLYAPKDRRPAGASHSKVIETSRYQLPAAAILLRTQEFPADAPFVICNRVLGELAIAPGDDDERKRYIADSALMNYALRTPHYLLGSTLQNPSLSITDSATGNPSLKYSGVSRQNRWCGLLVDNPTADEISAVYPVVDKTRGGRPQHSHWSVQHENILLLQRIARQSSTRIGSYSTGKLGIRFQGQAWDKVEEDGWIFATAGKVFVALRFLDGNYEWNEKQEEASPVDFDHAAKTRVLLHAGDSISHRSFTEFRASVLANSLAVSADKVDYRDSASQTQLEATLFDGNHPERFVLPQINGSPIDLRPPTTYQSPYLNAEFGNPKISVTVGPVSRVLDFAQ